MDIHVGSRIRQRRRLIGMSRQRLGDALGLSIVQVWQYEQGLDHVGVTCLFNLANLLNVPISYFYDDAPGSAVDPTDPPPGPVVDNRRPEPALRDRQPVPFEV